MNARAFPDAVRLVPATRDDRARIGGWLADPAVRAWWGTPSAVEAEISIAMASEGAICRMIQESGVPVGYAQALDARLVADRDDTEPGTWQCAFFIASELHRGRGLGAEALSLLADEVLSTTLAIGCCIRVPVRNERAVREIEARGFRWLRVESDATLGPVWIMCRARSRNGGGRA